ncbi:hypothetical protein [Flavobacterium sp.]|uniref:hypothetical protein n=1 Tax=Flavobacterium sp. TaxID=239 RepID=UPI002FDABE15
MTKLLHIQFITLTAVVVLFFTACKNEKKVYSNETHIDVNHLNKANNISLKTAVIANEFINQNPDTLWVNTIQRQKKKNQKIDTLLKSLAQQNLIVLTDTVFKKQKILNKMKSVNIETYITFLKTQKNELQILTELNSNLQLQNYLNSKINEMERNISELKQLHTLIYQDSIQ